MMAVIQKLAQGNVHDSNGLFIETENQPELVGRIGDKPIAIGHFEQICDGIMIDICYRPKELR